MAIANSYPMGTPKSSDLLLGTSVPSPGTNEKATTRNFSLSQVGALVNTVNLGYTSYVVELNAGAGAVPTVITLQNTTGLAFAWTRNSAGVFTATTSAEGIPANKFFGSISGKSEPAVYLQYGIKTTTTNTFTISNFNGTNGTANDGLSGCYVEIRIYA
tara:strand:+ start:16 stop:492 length:477 start_codon:yes stop_codon:yes gene_type:complete